MPVSMGPDSRADDGVDGGERRGALEDDHVALVGVVEAAERLADTTPAGLEVTRLLHVPRFVIALRQRTLPYHADSLTE